MQKDGYDRVEIPSGADGGLPRRLSRSQFEALPLDQRVAAILSKRLRFFRNDREISIREALGQR
jgi:hypothetical protein